MSTLKEPHPLFMGHVITPETVVVGCDVGKTHHQLHAMDSAMGRLGRRRIHNTRRGVDEAMDWVAGLADDVVLVIDQKASYAALLRYLADRHDITVVYVTGLQARRATDLTPGRAKTDRIDAEVLASFGRTHGHRLPVLVAEDELTIDMRLLLGRDEDLRCDFNRIINRLRDLLTQYCPDLEQALGRRLSVKGVLSVLARWGNPAKLARARATTITKTIAEHNPRMAAKVAEIVKDATSQTMNTAGLGTAGRLISQLAVDALRVTTERNEIQGELTELAVTHPDYELLMSVPGLGAKTAVRFIAEVGDIKRFPTPGHLASYAGLAPVNRQSGTGLNTVAKDRAGNHRLKNALFLAAFVASRHDPTAIEFYQQQRNRGKHHNAATIAVARKRCNIIWAVLTKQQPYTPQKPPKRC